MAIPRPTSGVVSNVGEWAIFLQEIVNQINSGQLRFIDNDNITMNMTNTASTTSKNGQEFRYYEVVNKGRNPIAAKGGKRLYFTVGRTYPIFLGKDVVGPAAAFNITSKSMAKINGTFKQELAARATNWITNGRLPQTQSAKNIAKNNLIRKIGNFATSARNLLGKASSSRLVIRDRLQKGNPNKDAFIKTKAFVISKGLKKDKAVSTGRAKAKPEAIRREVQFRHLFPNADTTLLNFIRQGPSNLSPDQIKFFEDLTRIPDKDALLGIVMDIVEEGINTFESNTPTLSQFKLLSDGTVLSPKSGGQLRDSYKIESNKDLNNI